MIYTDQPRTLRLQNLLSLPSDFKTRDEWSKPQILIPEKIAIIHTLSASIVIEVNKFKCRPFLVTIFDIDSREVITN